MLQSMGWQELDMTEQQDWLTDNYKTTYWDFNGDWIDSVGFLGGVSGKEPIC